MYYCLQWVLVSINCIFFLWIPQEKEQKQIHSEFTIQNEQVVFTIENPSSSIKIVYYSNKYGSKSICSVVFSNTSTMLDTQLYYVCKHFVKFQKKVLEGALLQKKRISSFAENN